MEKWQDVFNAPDKVKCDCVWPNVQRSGSQALGVVLDIDLCCLAKAVEELSGKQFIRVVDTEPAFEWDCDAVQHGPRCISKVLVYSDLVTLGNPLPPYVEVSDEAMKRYSDLEPDDKRRETMEVAHDHRPCLVERGCPAPFMEERMKKAGRPPKSKKHTH